jgi:hypothetical protein
MVPDISDAQGFIIVKRNGRFHIFNNVYLHYCYVAEKKKRIKAGKLFPEDIYLQPEGWTKNLSVALEAKISEEDAKENVYIIIPSLFKENVDKGFEIRVYGDESTVVEEL